MVKNIPTIERSTKIRFGKHAEDNQAENTIVFNASNAAINASSPGGVYMTPLRQASVGGATFIGYDAITKEVVDTNVLTSLLGGISLDEASKQGNVVTNTSPHFANVLTAFTTRYGSNVGIANTSPIHALDVGENLHITRHGNVITSGKITAGQFYGDGGTLSNIQVGLDDVIIYSNTASSKTVEFNYASGPSLITAGKVGISNANPTHTLDVGSNLYVEDTAANVLNVTGNVNVSNYLKTNKLEVSSLEVDAVTAGTVSSNIIGDNVNVNTITTDVVSLNSISPGDLLVGPSSGTVLDKLSPHTASGKKFLRSSAAGVAWDDVSSTLQTITDGGASTTNEISFTNGVTSLTASGNVLVSGNVTTGTPIAIASGGTGLNSFTENDLLLGPASGGTALDKLSPHTASGKKFLRSSAAGVAWDDVSSTLQTITDGGASTNNEISFTNGVTSLTASGNVLVAGNVTASIIKSTSLTSGKIPYVNNDNEIIDGPIGHDSTTNNTFVSSNLYVTGNLNVQGETFFQDSNIHVISDPLIELGNANVINTIDMGIIMTRPTANVVSGYMGDEKKYVIAYTHSDPHGAHIVPTNSSSDQYITLSVEGGNVLAGNVTTTGKMTADTFHGDGSAITNLDLGDATNTGQVAIARGGTGVATGLTVLDPTHLSSEVLLAKGGTGLTAVAQNELLLGPASGTALSKLSPHTTTSKKFLRSDNTGVAWDDVSSTLQAITDGGATTTQTVAFNNTTTGLTSAGDIDIAATKQIDYAGDVLIKSSAGAVASLKVTNVVKLDPSYATSSHNVLSIDTTTTPWEIYDSGGQGGSSFTNIREEGSNVSIGPTAASANLEVNTYGSNVLTVSGNVAADNITIGSLHVAASPFNFDDVVSVSTGANVTSNVITVGGLVTSGSVEADNITVTGNATSQNIKLTNTDISAAISSGTITIDAREKSYGTAPLVTSTDDVSNLVFSNLISGSQIVVPILASGGTIKISKELTNVNFYAMTTDVSVNQDKHALMTLSNVSGNIYMNALAFA